MSACDQMIEDGRHALLSTGMFSRFTQEIRREFRWTCSAHAAESKVSQWFSGKSPHQLPARALPVLVRVTGLDPFTPILLRAAIDGRKPAMRRVPEERQRA